MKLKRTVDAVEPPAAVLLADKIGRIRLQAIGFIGCVVGMLPASLPIQTTGVAHLMLLFGGFMLFNFMTNLGPNAMIYLLAGEVFPYSIRGAGAGLAASFAKIGAVFSMAALKCPRDRRPSKARRSRWARTRGAGRSVRHTPPAGSRSRRT